MDGYEIREMDLKAATEADFVALNRHANLMRRERLPDDPPISLQETTQNMKTIPPFVGFRAWGTWEKVSGEMVGFATAVWFNTEDNQHLMQMDIDVLPEHRRRGIGRAMLRLVVDEAKARNRRLLMTNTNSRVTGGDALMERLGGQRGLAGHTNQLDMHELDRGLVNKWMAEASSRAPGYNMGFWDGAYPEEQIQAVCELLEVANQQPKGDMELEDMHNTPEIVRQMEENLFARGSKRWTYYVTEKASGKLVGYTELTWHPKRSHIRNQGITGVFPEHRNQGLGRWLKAAMLERVLAEEPPVRFIRTGNANENAPMLKINEALGFKPYFAMSLWQVPVDKVEEYFQQ